MEWQTKMLFDEAWNIIFSSKRRSNKVSLSSDDYKERITLVHQLKEQVQKGRVTISVKNLRILSKFNVITKGGCEWLVKPSPLEDTDQFLLYVSNDELFDVLHEAHLESNHGTEEQMLERIRLRYCNVTREAVSTYLALCPHCRNPRGEDAVRAISPKLVPTPPAVPVSEPPAVPVLEPPRRSFQNYVYGASVYFGFVDMRRWACHGYSYILVHWDVDSRFMNILPLHTLHYVNVAISLMDIYATFGMPRSLDAPYSIHYINLIVDHIKSVWHTDVSINLRTSDDINALINGWNYVQKLMEPWLANETFKHNWPSKIKSTQYLINAETFSGSSSSSATRPPSDINPLV